MNLQPGIDYRAAVYTSCGDFKIDLLEDRAPIAVNNFIALSRSGFFDGLMWHQLSPGALIQTGDPDGINGHSPDGPGYWIKDELPESTSAYTYGAVAMANTGVRDSSGSQFFIVVHEYMSAYQGQPRPLGIQPDYTLFGHVPQRFWGSLENIAQQETIGSGDEVQASRPRAPVYIERVIIEEVPLHT